MQQMLDQQAKTNDHLSAMRELLLKESKSNSNSRRSGTGGNSSGSGSGGAGGNRGGSTSGSYSKAFKELFGEGTKLATGMAKGSTTASTAMAGLGTSAKVLQASFSKIPGPVGLVATSLLKVVEVGTELYQYMQEQLTMYTQLSSAGLSLNQGMISVKKGTTASLMSQKDFSDAITRNADIVATMNSHYADGVAQMGQLVGSIQMSNSEMKAWGITQGQMVDLAARSYKFNKLYASQQTLMQMDEVQSSKEFIKQQTTMARTLGISVDKLTSKFNTLGDTTESYVINDQLKKRFDMSDEMAVKASKASNELFASMQNGEQMQKLVAQFMATNTIPDEFKNNAQVYRQIREISNIIGSGITDPVELQAMYQKYLTENMETIEKAIAMAYQTQDTATAQLLVSTRNMSKLMNARPKEVQSKLEDITNRVNDYMNDSIIKPFKEISNYLEEGAINWLHSVIMTDKGFGQATLDSLSAGWADISSWFSKIFWSMADNARDSIKWLMSDGLQILKDSFFTLVDNLKNLPDMLWQSVKDWWNDGESLADKAENAKNDLANTVSDSIQSVTSWWDSAKSWWNTEKPTESTKPTTAAKPTVQSSDKSKAQRTQVTSTPEYTKPTQVESVEKAQVVSETDPAQLQAAQNHEALIRAISQLLNSVDGQRNLTNQTNQMMRQLVTNTEPQHNL